MSEIVLTGLNEKHFPLSALAAFGLLSICSRIGDFRDAKLSWREMPLWTPVLHVAGEADAEHLVDALLKYLETAHREQAKEFNFASDLGKIDPQDYGEFVRNAITQRDWRAAEFAAAYGSELVLKDAGKNKGKMQPTLFFMTSGNQEWFKLVKELAKAFSSKSGGNSRAEELLKEALFGPWTYEEGHSLGWDPSMERLHAYQPIAPTKDKRKRESGAILLAVEALSLFPCAYTARRLATACYFQPQEDGRREQRGFYFPVWDCPIGRNALRSLLGLPFEKLVDKDKGIRELRARGVSRVYRAARIHTGGQNGDYHIFSYPVPCF